jgi:hypothetical protein
MRISRPFPTNALAFAQHGNTGSRLRNHIFRPKRGERVYIFCLLKRPPHSNSRPVCGHCSRITLTPFWRPSSAVDHLASWSAPSLKEMGERVSARGLLHIGSVKKFLTINPQHQIHRKKIVAGFGPKARFHRLSLGRRTKVRWGLKGVTLCPYVACDPKRICFLRSR